MLRLVVDMTEQKTEQKPDHEKRIREALGYCLETGGVGFTVASADLRALLADLDAVRGALEALVLNIDAGGATMGALADARAALKGASHE